MTNFVISYDYENDEPHNKRERINQIQIIMRAVSLGAKCLEAIGNNINLLYISGPK